jgi:Ca2+-transporting ATPase
MAATKLGEVLLSFTALAAGMGQPLNPRQLLWINVITDVFPELALAVAPASEDLMSRPPRAAAEPLLPRSDYGPVISQSAVMSGAALAAYIAGISRYGISPQASSMAFLTLTSAQLLHGISAQTRGSVLAPGARPPKNPLMTMSILGGFAALGFAQFGLPALLGSARIGLGSIAFCAGASTAGFLFNDALLRAHFLERPNGHS